MLGCGGGVLTPLLWNQSEVSSDENQLDFPSCVVVLCLLTVKEFQKASLKLSLMNECSESTIAFTY